MSFFSSFFLPTRAKILLFIAINPWGLYGKLPVGTTVSGDQRSREHPLAKFTVTGGSNQPCLSLPAVIFGKRAQVKHGPVPSLLPDTRNLPSGRTIRGVDPFSRVVPQPGARGPQICCSRDAAGKGRGDKSPRHSLLCSDPSSQPRHSSRSPQPSHPPIPCPLPSGDGCDACALTPSLPYVLPKKRKHHCPINYVSYGAIFFPESPTGSHIRFPGSLASSLATG